VSSTLLPSNWLIIRSRRPSTDVRWLTCWLTPRVLTAIISASYLEEVEYLSWDMKAEALDAPKEAVGDSKV
jgi:hypothetical protein